MLKATNLLFLCIPFLLNATQPTPEAKIKDFIKLINPNAKLLNYTTHNVLGGVYQIRTTKNEFVVSKDFKIMFPTKNTLLQKNKDGKYKQLFIPYDLTKHTKDAALKIGQGKAKLFTFISPTCIFSNNLFKKLTHSNSIKNKYTIYFYFYLPKSKESEYERLDEQLTNYIVAQETLAKKISKYKEIINSKNLSKYNYLNLSNEQRKLFKSNLNKNYQLAQTVGVIGTPNIFEANAKPFYFKTEEF